MTRNTTTRMAPPSIHTRAVLTWIAIFPLVAIGMTLIAPVTEGWHPVLRALVLTLMLGKEGVDLVAQLGRQLAGTGTPRPTYWGELITKSLPRAAVGPLVDRLKSAFIRQFAAKGGASVIGKALPFGIGAAVGGTGNHLLGRRVVVGSRRAFGGAPLQYPAELEPRPGATRWSSSVPTPCRRTSRW